MIEMISDACYDVITVSIL